MSRPAERPDRDRGETLVELLVSMVLLGTAVIAIVTGLGTTAIVSDAHRKQATAGAELRNFAEKIGGVVNADAAGYVSCATATSYTSAYTAPTGYTASVTAVRYWTTGAAWSATCSADIGLQKLTLQIRSSDGRVTETLDYVVRRPCSAGQSCT